MDFLVRFQQSTKEQNLHPESARLLLAVSGGVDSVVMAHLFLASGFRVSIAHCNFQLRGVESDEDALFVERLAAELEASFYVQRFDTEEFAIKSGVSIQMAARTLRYAWFQSLADQHGYRQVATAHHLNDSVETALLNFIRGTGLAGMTGMHQTRGAMQTIVRPLLFATRDEIIEYASVQGIQWREDRSNASDDYARNYLRHHIMPEMGALNPNFLRTAERNLLRFADAHENLTFLTRQYLGLEHTNGHANALGYSLDKQKLLQLPSPRQALQAILKPHGFTSEQTRQLSEKIQDTGFELFSDSGWRVLCDRENIVVQLPSTADNGPQDHKPVAPQRPTADVRVVPTDLMVRLPDGTALFLMPGDLEPPFPDGAQAVLVDRRKIQYPLTIRHWEEGDVFRPFGMGGQSQKLQDFFTNRKLSRIEKEQVWLLVNADGAIIWVLGMRLDERFRVEKTTVEGLKITWM